MEVLIDLVKRIIFLISDRKYIVNIGSYVAQQDLVSNCNEIAFSNTGTTNVTLNSALLIPPGGSFAVSGNRNEIDTTLYSIVFSGAGNNSCIVIRKYYK